MIRWSVAAMTLGDGNSAVSSLRNARRSLTGR